MKKFAIVTCVTPNWLAPAAVTLLSCAKHGAAEIADLIIVSFDVPAEQLQALDAFNVKHTTKIQILQVDLGELRTMGKGRLGVGALLRLKLNTFLPPDYNRIVYLDSDVLADSDCKDIFKSKLNGKAFGAVESTAMLPWINKNASNHLHSITLINSVPYFNSGVLLFDWKKTLQSNFLPKSFSLIQQNQNWPFQDQDALNAAADGNWAMLDHKYNVTKKTADYLNFTPVFRHFNGSSKPWNAKSRIGFKRYHRFYVESLSDTPWQEFIERPQNPWPIKDNWRALVRKLSFRKIARLKHHISLVAERP